MPLLLAHPHATQPPGPPLTLCPRMPCPRVPLPCSDMLLAQKKTEETKQALAIAYQTAGHIEDKGPQVGWRWRRWRR